MVFQQVEILAEKNILVTGGAGFIGMKLIERLARAGTAVRCLDNRPLPAADWIEGRVALYQGDLGDGALLDRALSGVKTVIHLAAVTDAKHEKRLREVNVAGTGKLVKSACQQGVGSMIFLSSVDAGLPAPGAYGQSKREGEEIIRSGFPDALIFRSTFVYGPGDTKNLQALIRLIRKTPVIPVVGNGRNRSQPVFVEDLAGLIASAAEKRNEPAGTYEVGGAEPMTFDELIRAVSQALGLKRYLIHLPAGPVLRAVQAMEGLFAIMGIEREKLRDFLLDKVVDNTGIRRDFHCVPQAFDAGLRKMAQSGCFVS